VGSEDRGTSQQARLQNSGACPRRKTARARLRAPSSPQLAGQVARPVPRGLPCTSLRILRFAAAVCFSPPTPPTERQVLVECLEATSIRYGHLHLEVYACRWLIQRTSGLSPVSDACSLWPKDLAYPGGASGAFAVVSSLASACRRPGCEVAQRGSEDATPGAAAAFRTIGCVGSALAAVPRRMRRRPPRPRDGRGAGALLERGARGALGDEEAVRPTAAVSRVERTGTIAQRERRNARGSLNHRRAQVRVRSIVGVAAAWLTTGRRRKLARNRSTQPRAAGDRSLCRLRLASDRFHLMMAWRRDPARRGESERQQRAVARLWRTRIWPRLAGPPLSARVCQQRSLRRAMVQAVGRPCCRSRRRQAPATAFSR
jgi:hypothetical protein